MFGVLRRNPFQQCGAVGVGGQDDRAAFPSLADQSATIQTQAGFLFQRPVTRVASLSQKWLDLCHIVDCGRVYSQVPAADAQEKGTPYCDPLVPAGKRRTDSRNVKSSVSLFHLDWAPCTGPAKRNCRLMSDRSVTGGGADTVASLDRIPLYQSGLGGGPSQADRRSVARAAVARPGVLG